MGNRGEAYRVGRAFVVTWQAHPAKKYRDGRGARPIHHGQHLLR
jgi:hypothetical protein